MACPPAQEPRSVPLAVSSNGPAKPDGNPTAVNSDPSIVSATYEGDISGSAQIKASAAAPSGFIGGGAIANGRQTMLRNSFPAG